MLARTISLIALAGAVLAQDQTIHVGGEAPNNIFVFTPPNITATVGSVITFVYDAAPGNHSVTQSSFSDPCNPLPNGFDSGWVEIDAPGDGSATWNLTITNASVPIWFYCKQLAPGPHCSAGMVGAINANNVTNTYAEFVSAAEAFKGNSGQGVGLLVGADASASAPPGPITGSLVAWGVPTGTAPTTTVSATGSASGSSTGSSGSSSPSTSSSAAIGSNANPMMAFFAALFGVALL